MTASFYDLGNPNSFKDFIAKMSTASHFDFTFEKHNKEAEFLDLCVLTDSTNYETKTFQKELSLYLYLPATSAHPRGMLKSLAYGRIKKYWK